jgi:glucose/arabinose dehydrogenase
MSHMHALVLAATATAAMAFPASGQITLTSERVASGLARPVYVCAPAGDTDRLFIVEQRSGSTGRIRILNLNTGSVNSTPFLSQSVSTSSEQGLLGMAFHPDYASNGYFFINYTNSSGNTIIERFTVSSNPDVANASSGVQVMSISQPYSNHNGGWLDFSPTDGMLYIGTGDGGSAGDPGNRAQDISGQKLGKMLRIDVDTLPYSSPADNPFVGVTGDDEIWSYGHRNPWRCAFDSVTGELWMADVGQNAWEEISVAAAGSDAGDNYGWRCYEGDHSYNTSGCPSSSTMTFPIHEFSHGGSPYRCSITGGEVYRGSAMPPMHGIYFFADYCSNQIWTLERSGNNAIVTDITDDLDPPSYSIASPSGFGLDGSGEMYICDLGGEVFKIMAGVPEGACCVNSTVCVALPESNCISGGGTYHGDFSACGDVDCAEACDGDCNGDGTVDVIDLLQLIADYGSSSACDWNGDGNATVEDILVLLGAWGPC